MLNIFKWNFAPIAYNLRKNSFRKTLLLEGIAVPVSEHAWAVNV